MLIRFAAALALVAMAGAALAQTAAPAPGGGTVQERGPTQPIATEASEQNAARTGPLGSFRPRAQIACEFLGPCGKCDCSPSPVQQPGISAQK